MMAFDQYIDHLRWVAWRTEARGEGKATKVPYSPSGKKAKADDPTTWGPRIAAEARAKQLINGAGSGGIGIELGDLGDGTALGGIDLDTCLVDGTFEPWAEEVIARFNTYGEVSPSGTGAKLFFLYDATDLAELRKAMGTQHGREFKRGTGKDHPPAIELHLTNRYFTVTEQRLATSPDEITIVDNDTLLWLIKEAGPEFASTKRKDGAAADKSRSATAFRKGAALRRSGATFEQMCEALRTDAQTSDWYAEKGSANGDRELHRIWKRAEPGEGKPSEDELANRFTERHSGARYIATWGRWLFWAGGAWMTDETLRVFDWSRTICREAAKSVANAKTVAAVVSLARSDPRHAATPDTWDAVDMFISGKEETNGR